MADGARTHGAHRWRTPRGGLMRRYLSAVLWAYLVWNLLTWTATFQNWGVGLGVALLAGAALAATGEVVPPWYLLNPRRLAGIAWLIGVLAMGVIRENIKMACRIYLPSRPLASGMVIAATDARSDGEVGVVGLATSLIVDNQIIDLDRTRHLLQFHGIALPPPGERSARQAINGPVEGPLLRISRR